MNKDGLEWLPSMPDVDPSTAGRGSYDVHIDGITVVNSIPKDSVDTYSNKTQTPGWTWDGGGHATNSR